MTDAELRKLLNTGERKYSEHEINTLLSLLKRMAEIEYSNNMIRKNSSKNEK